MYSGIEWQQGSKEAKQVIDFLNSSMDTKISDDSGIGIKNISIAGTKRLVRMALDYAVTHNRKSVTFVHKGNIMKFTEGAFRNWGYEVARETDQRLRHEGCREAVRVSHVVDAILVDLELVGLGDQGIKTRADLALSGRADLVMMHLDIQAHISHCQAHCRADILQGINRWHGKVTPLDPGTMTDVAVLVFLAGAPGRFH